ncbi:hypothetical protein ACFSFW_23530 [Fredinandcohnia salidurans]|uniref:Uncharacterized protein n=1 Tax=Fredinandcohnia salidurans TaxID=2595041 RepID=A0ABW4MUJ1_9BACI
MAKRRTHQEYIDLITAKYGKAYKLLTEYTNSKSTVEFFCNVCNQNHTMIARHLLKGGCSLCARKIVSLKNTLSEKDFNERLTRVHGYRIVNIDPYVKRNEKIRFYATDCQHIWKATPDLVLSGNWCNVCALDRSIKTRTKTHNQFCEEVFQKGDGDYIVLGKYVKTDVKIKLKHLICNYEYDVTPHSFLDGRRCPKCFSTPIKTTSKFKDELYNLVGSEYEVVGDYGGNKKKIKIKHNKCKNGKHTIFEMVPNSFLSGRRCPECSPSKKDSKESFMRKLKKVKGEDYVLSGDYINNSTKVQILHKCGYEW